MNYVLFPAISFRLFLMICSEATSKGLPRGKKNWGIYPYEIKLSLLLIDLAKTVDLIMLEAICVSLNDFLEKASEMREGIPLSS